MFNAAGAAAQDKRWKFPLGKPSGLVIPSFLHEFNSVRSVAAFVVSSRALSLRQKTHSGQQTPAWVNLSLGISPVVWQIHAGDIENSD